MYTIGLGIGLVFSLRVLLPRYGGPATLGLGLCMLIVTCGSIIYVCGVSLPKDLP